MFIGCLLRLPGGPRRAQLIVFQTGAGGAPRYSGAQQPHRRRLTHIAAQRESAIFNLTWRTVRGEFPPPPHKSYFLKLIINSDKKCEATKEVVLFPPDGAYGRVHPDALRVTSGSCRVPADWSPIERLEITLKLNYIITHSIFSITSALIQPASEL